MTTPTHRLVLALLLLASGAARAQEHRVLTPEVEMPESRIALVFGNGAYAHTSPLPNPPNDARDVSAALRRVGFTVVSGIDLSNEGMRIALDDFAARAQSADVAMFFYAGHGVQVGSENYLLPVDANIQREIQVPYRSMGLGEVLGYLDDSGARLKVIVLDACRNNPFKETWRGTGDGGWAATAGPSGSVIAFATAPGALASDNSAGRNGLYTEALLAEIEKPGVELGRMLRSVSFRVKQATGGQQEPWVTQSYNGDFFFVPEGRTAAPATQPLAPPVASPSQPAPRSAPPRQRRVVDRSAEIGAINERARGALRLFDLQDYAAAASALQRPALEGHAEAQSALGYLYQHGLGVPVNASRAAELYQNAAESGHAAAQTNLGYLYEMGLGVTRDASEAARLYALAAEQGRAAAKNNYGAMLLYGRGVEQDQARAATLFAEAAAEGIPAAEANLAFVLENGLGVEKSEFQAAMYYLKASSQDHPWAIYRLGMMYAEGRGISRDLAEARTYFARAADLGVVAAREALSLLPAANGLWRQRPA